MIRKLKKNSLIRKLYTFLKYIKWRIDSLRDRALHKRVVKNPVWVKTSSINLWLDDLKVPIKSKILLKRGVLFGGNWDLYVKYLKDYDYLTSFRQRFIDEKEWSETEMYNRVLKLIESGIEKQGCRTKNEWDNHLLETDELFAQINENGYKTQEEMKSKKPWDEINVGIGRDKQIIFLEGRHRLSIAKALDLKEIPVYICVIHPKAYD